MIAKRRRIKPYLLPQCPLEYARGIYQGEGTTSCTILHEEKRARLETAIMMKDKDALLPLEPCFGAKVYYIPAKKAWRIRRRHLPALDIAQQLATTPYRKQQIQQALKRCQEQWQKGYRK